MTTHATARVPRPPSVDSFAGRLRLARLDSGDLSVQQAAKACGIPTPTWRKWEHGTKPHDIEKAARQVEAGLGIYGPWLMAGIVLVPARSLDDATRVLRIRPVRRPEVVALDSRPLLALAS